MKFQKIAFVGLLSAVSIPALYADSTVDPNLYLEDSHGAKALSWVKAQNARTLPSLENDPLYAPIKQKVSKIVLAQDRIPSPSYQGVMVYNFWQDNQHVRGLWRRTTLADYAQENPHWESVLDLDALATAEKENWVWKSVNCLSPTDERCMIELSRGGQDASVFREFDVKTKSFVPGGFAVPEAKSSVSWLDRDDLLVATDFGPGSLTQSGYARIVKLWKRGTPLSTAKTLFTGKISDIEVDSLTYPRAGGTLAIVVEGTTFFTNDLFLADTSALTVKKLPFPNDAELVGVFDGVGGQVLLLQLRSDWKLAGESFAAGSVVSIPLSGPLAQAAHPEPSLIYAPTSETAVQAVAVTASSVYVSILDDVKGRLLKYTPSGLGPKEGWKSEEIPLPDSGTVSLLPSEASGSTLLLAYQSFLVPPTVYAVQDGAKASDPLVTLRKSPDRFDPSPYAVNQYWSISKDGTKIPYFVIARKDVHAGGQNPTLLYGYGGFEISETPFYLSTTGKVWLDAGGIYALANIRGGGEFGPRWHEAAILQNRQKAYDDFISVAQDLIARKLTSPRRLAIEGGSNGGLLVGATFVERPDLFNAVVCQVPLLDMIRYPLLGAGASWEGEYGDPNDPTMRQAILGYSPYQNLKPGVTYPEVYFETSTEDDRVTPAHARKMAALMQEQGHPFYFYENTEGGHAADANLEEEVTRLSLEFTYLFRKVVQ